MQSSLKVPLPKELSEALKQKQQLQKLQTATELLSDIIHQHADQISYMLQAYHPREKVSQLTITEGSVNFNSDGVVTLQLQYVLEEFNVCSAIDFVQKDKMKITVTVDHHTDELVLEGENWPERD